MQDIGRPNQIRDHNAPPSVRYSKNGVWKLRSRCMFLYLTKQYLLEDKMDGNHCVISAM